MFANSKDWRRDDLFDVIGGAMAPPHFVARGVSLEWEAREQTASWEVFRGCLLDPRLTREQRTFHAWNVYVTNEGVRSAEPVLSVKLDEKAGVIHVVRAIACYGWVAVDSASNVIDGRDAVKWVRELVGTIRVAEFATPEELCDELACRLFQAVVGTSRLPLTSLEAPLPAFTFGQLAYSPTSVSSWAELVEQSLNPDLSRGVRAKLLEFVIRAVSMAELPGLAKLFAQGVGSHRAVGVSEFAGLLRTLFNEVSLSPYTDFVDKTLALVEHLVEAGYLTRADEADFLGYLLRQLGRHLTAYDLITFHHRGANYPDALLLDAALKTYLALVERCPDLFAGGTEEIKERRRRRALRQGCLFRHLYQGHAVPDVPTSPGENTRVLSARWQRVPEEQILQPGRRQRHLYADESLAALLTPTARRILQQSLDDLACPEELRELGTGVFIDRPFGAGKEPGEPDQTPLLAYDAFSRSVAGARLAQMSQLALRLGLRLDAAERGRQLEALDVPGLPATAAWAPERAVVSLADARRVAADFVLVRTLPSSVGAFLDLARRDQLAFMGLAALEAAVHLIVRVPAPNAIDTLHACGYVVALFDREYRKRAELAVDTSVGFRSRGGREWPAGGVRLLRLWRETAEAVELREIESPGASPPGKAVDGL